ncbi:transcription factor jumonji (JmjC) domain protein, partial [Trifolium pratense]
MYVFEFGVYDQDGCEIDDTTLILGSKSYSLMRTAAMKKPKYIEPKVPKWIEEESLMCHQCQNEEESDAQNAKGKDIVYPHLKEDEIATACPVCCDNCNCKACLRSSTFIK